MITDWLQYDTDGSEHNNDNDNQSDNPNDIENDNDNDNETNFVYNDDEDIHNIPVPHSNRLKNKLINNELEDWDTTATPNNNNNNNNNNSINNYNDNNNDMNNINNNNNYYNNYNENNNQIDETRYSCSIPEVKPFSLWIGKLPQNIQEFHIRQYFESFHITLIDIRIRVGKKGSICAYIDLQSKSDLINALLTVDSINAPLLLNKRIKIDTTEILQKRYNKNGEYYNDNNNYYNYDDSNNYYNSKSRNVYSKRRNNDTKYESQTPKFNRQNKFSKKWSPNNMQRSQSVNDSFNYNNSNSAIIYDPVLSTPTPKKILKRNSDPTTIHSNRNIEDIKYEEKSNNSMKRYLISILYIYTIYPYILMFANSRVI